MGIYGVVDTGFIKKSYDAIINSLHDGAKRMFGGDVDLTPGSPIKILLDLYALELTSLWSQLEACYNSAFLATATGQALDNIGKLVGSERTSSMNATGKVTFFRNTILSSGTPRIIPAGTKVSTATIRSKEYVTTESVYFQPIITAEEHIITDPVYTIDTINIIHSIQTVYDDDGNDYTENITFSGRTITFTTQINTGTIIYIDYKPLSITASIQAVDSGADSNVAANTITILDTPIDFIHYISNENGIDSGSDVESDSHFRNKIIGATQAIGKATTNALKYYIEQVTDVKNVIIEDPLRIIATNEITGTGTTSFFVPHTPVYSIDSITGSINGAYTIDSFDAQSGELTLTTSTSASEIIIAVYTYVVPGKIKIYVEGGTIGDEFTPDTIVYAIENTRAAGIQSVGYDTDDAAACGSLTAPFSWFYRPNNAAIDIDMTVYFDSDTSLSDAAKVVILDQIQDSITDYINNLTLQDKIYKNKIIQLAIGANADIVDAQITKWKLNDVEMDITRSYLQAGNMEISIARLINLTKAVG